VDGGGVVEEAAPARAAPRRWHRPVLPLAVGLVVVGFAAALLVRGREAPAPAARTLTHLPGVETHPAFSPDGRRVAFSAVARGGADADVWVTGLDAAEPVRLTRGPEEDLYPVWSPDGEAVAFLRCRARACGIFSVPVLGGGARRVLDAPVGRWGLGWSPDGRRFVAVARPAPERPYRVLLLDARTGAARPLTAPPPGEVGDLSPAFSPDGRHVAFVRHGAGGEDVWVVPTAGGAARRVTARGVPLDGYAWAPEGDAVVVAAAWDGAQALWRTRLAGGLPERLALAAPSPRNPAFAGGRLVFETRQVEVNLYAADLDAPRPALVPAVVSTGASTQPALRPDGRRVAFVSERSGAAELWTAGVDGSAPVRLTDFRGARVGAPRWSPDGRWIAFEAQRGGRAAIYRVAADGGTPVAVTDGAGYDFGPRFSRDGRALYFASDRSPVDLMVWRVPVGGGREPVGVAEGYVGEETADGRGLLVTSPQVPGLWLDLFAGHPRRRIDSTLATTDWGSWAVTTRGVLLLERTAAGARVVRLDPATGRREVVLDVAGGVPSGEPALAVTPDGRRLVVARADRVESALMLVEGEE
jgi:Tol biopolymer transport system component